MHRIHLDLSSVAVVILLGITTGCAQRGDAPIPPHAFFGSEGAGRLSYVATEDGTVQVYDMNRNELIFATHVTAGQQIIVDPRGDRITVDGRRILEGRMNAGNRHAIYLLPGATAQRRMDMDRDAVPAGAARD